MKVTRLHKFALASVGTLLLLGGALFSLRARPAPSAAPPVELLPQKLLNETAQTVYDGRFKDGWEYWGLGAHELKDGTPARISFESFGGLLVHRAEQPSTFGSLGFRYRAPAAFGSFLKVTLKRGTPEQAPLPSVVVADRHVTQVPGDWWQVWIPFAELNAKQVPFDRIAIEARKSVSAEWVEIDGIVLTKTEAGSTAPTRAVKLAVACTEPAKPISPWIYGVMAQESPGLNEGAHRIGGNTMSRLNWELGAWNTGNDWFFENVKGDKPTWSWFEGARKGVRPLAMVVPLLGWVAKDATSVGFPVSRLGPQRKTDPHRADAGDGFKADGTPLKPLPPTQTSIAAPPSLVKSWLQRLRDEDQQLGGRALSMYILDNEPSLWSVTHRDVHPEPLGYDELYERTVQYGEMIRKLDPDAVIAGPAEWGWSAYFDSAKDLASKVKSDRLLHGNKPLLAWYLSKLATYEKETGTRLLDFLDVHFYPQGAGVYGAQADASTAALRLRSTRALWDPDYEDESWIKDRVKLIPRMRALIDENYPGRKLTLGEYSFGAEQHISGGLALAEALGRFGQQQLDAAFLWAKLEPGTPGYLGFTAFRNFDGKGSTFQELSVAAPSANDLSLFLSRDSSGKRYVAVLINLDPALSAQVTLSLGKCSTEWSGQAFGFGPDSRSMEVLGPVKNVDASTLELTLPPYTVRTLALSAN